MTADPPPPSRRWWRMVLATAGLMAVGAWVAVPRVLGPRVDIVHATRGPLVQSVVTSGRVRPPGRVTVAPLVSARVGSVLADEGSEVEAGAVVLELDDGEARADVEQARARLDEIIVQGKGLQTTDARGAAEAVRRARTRLQDARRTQARIRDLFDQGVTSEETLDQSNTTLSLAESELRAAELQQRDVRGTQSNRIEAARQQAEAALAAAELRLEQHRLRVPFDGVVTERGVEKGDIVQPGTMAFVVVRHGETELVVEPDERNLALLKMGQGARASAEAFPDQAFDAVVGFIAPAVDPRRGTLEVRLRVPSPPEYLRPDMTVSVEIMVGSSDDAVIVPSGAIRDLSGEQPWVLVAEDGHATRRPVEVGIRGDAGVQVLSGIDERDALLDASQDISPGARVRPREPVP